MITDATRIFWSSAAVFGSTSRSGSRYVMSPAFSMAPYSKSGTAMWSSFGYGYSVPNQRSSMTSSSAPDLSAKSSSAPRPLGAMPRTCSGRERTSLGGSGGGVTTSKSPTASATR